MLRLAKKRRFYSQVFKRMDLPGGTGLPRQKVQAVPACTSARDAVEEVPAPQAQSK